MKPSTLPCGYTICQSCLSSQQPQQNKTCISPTCDRVHTIAIQPNVTIQQLQAIVTTFEPSHSLEALRNSFTLPTECPICCTRFTTPTTTPCGHVFCRNCLVRSLDHQRACPFCRVALDFVPPPTQLLNDILTKLYSEDDESMDVHAANDFDSSETRVPLLIGSVSFPHVNCVIHIFEPRYRLMLRRIMSSSRRRFGMCLARRKRTQQDQTPFYEYGTMMEMMHVQSLPDGRSIVQAVGSHRFRVVNFELIDGYHMADIERIDDIDREQENLLEQQQILKASAMRARSQQQQASVAAAPVVARPMTSRPMAAAVRPSSMAASAASVRAHAMSSRPPPSSMTQQMARHQVPGQQRTSWAQQAHPQTQQQVSRAPWLQMHVRGLSAARPKPHMSPSSAQQQTQHAQPGYPHQNLLPPTEKPIKHRQEQSTDELLDELASFIDKLLQRRQSASGSSAAANWLSALGDPPILRGVGRDRVIMSWWIVNMMPLGEDEKLPLLGMKTLRERLLVIVSWVDRFQDQWSLFLNHPAGSSSSSSASTMGTCRIM